MCAAGAGVPATTPKKPAAVAAVSAEEAVSAQKAKAAPPKAAAAKVGEKDGACVCTCGRKCCCEDLLFACVRACVRAASSVILDYMNKAREVVPVVPLVAQRWVFVLALGVGRAALRALSCSKTSRTRPSTFTTTCTASLPRRWCSECWTPLRKSVCAARVGCAVARWHDVVNARHGRGQIKSKTYGKVKLYFPDQAQYGEITSADLEALEAEAKVRRTALRRVVSAQLSLLSMHLCVHQEVEARHREVVQRKQALEACTFLVLGCALSARCLHGMFMARSSLALLCFHTSCARVDVVAHGRGAGDASGREPGEGHRAAGAAGAAAKGGHATRVSPRPRSTQQGDRAIQGAVCGSAPRGMVARATRCGASRLSDCRKCGKRGDGRPTTL